MQRPCEGGRAGVFRAVFALDRLSRLLTPADVGDRVRLQVVDAQGVLIVGGGGPDQADLLHPIPDAAAVPRRERDRKSTRLNSSHQITSYAFSSLKTKQQLT